MAGIYTLQDKLGESVGKLSKIQERVSSPTTAPVAYTPKVTLGSPDDWWSTLKQWVTVGIPSWIGPLTGLYAQLVEAGVITPAQAEQGLTKEELIALIKGIMEEEKKPWYASPWLPVTISVGVIGGAVTYYVAKRKR